MKLHELLAVKPSLDTQATKTRNDLASTFDKKRHLFEEKRITFTPNDEKGVTVTEEQKDIQTTVKKELTWIRDFLVKDIDASYQVAETNMTARGDIVLEDGVKLASNVPATALLELEKRVSEVGQLIAAIPTLDPAKGFKIDEARGIYLAREVVKPRTRKTKKLYVKYAATTEHPAQTELLDEDVPVGTIRELEWSGLITPGEKADLIARVEALSRAIRQARSRANETEVIRTNRIAGQLLDFIFG